MVILGDDRAPQEAGFGDVEEVFSFGDFQMLPSRRLLFEGDNRLPIGSRGFDILTVLVRAAGSVVSKEELLTRAWPGVYVQEGSLRVQINGLRKLLRDGTNDRRFIVNDAGRGYSFTAPVTMRIDGKPKTSGRLPWSLNNDLPHIVTEVFGRDASIQTLAVEMPKHRFITIVGPGGIGKTTLAVLAASTMCKAYGDGALFVDLAPINDPALVPSVLASALGLAVKSNDPMPDLLGFLRDKDLLVILDNCEHVIAAAATLVDVILSRTAKVQMLATSREPLCAKGERVHHLEPLETPSADQGLSAEEAMRFSAVQLFVDRTDAALGGFKLRDEDVPAVVEICRRLDGMALAIELATARVGTLGVSGVAAGLENRFQLLSKGLRTAPQRHRTLYAVFDWSYQLLKPAEQRVFRRLSVLAGRFPLKAAIAVAADSETSQSDVDECVAALVAATLVIAELTGHKATYRLLDSARAYGHEKLSESAEAEQVSKRLAAFCLDYFLDANDRSSGWSSIEWARSHKPNLDNLRTALDWCSSTNDLTLRDELTAAAIPLFSHLSLIEECRMRIQTALTKRPDGIAPDEKCEMQLHAGLGMSLSYTRGGGQDTNSAWQRCLTNAERVGDIDYQLRAIRGLWTSSFNAGDMQNVQRLGRQFDDVAGPSMSSENALMSRRMRGMELFYHGRITEARPDLQLVFDGYAKQKPGLDILRFQFDQTVVACVNLSKVLWLQGLPLQAIEMVEKGLNAAKLVNHDLSLIYTLAFGACRISINTGNFAAAEKYLEELFQYQLVEHAGPWKYFGQCWKGVLLSRQGCADAAVEILQEALDGIREGSFGMHHTRFLADLAFALARAGRVSDGLTAIRKAIDICERLNERWFLAEILRLEGEIIVLQHCVGTDLSRKCFLRAMTLAKQQGALAFELRAATSLVRNDTLVQRKASMGILNDIYGKLTEGFDTADLKDAKILLDSGCR